MLKNSTALSILCSAVAFVIGASGCQDSTSNAVDVPRPKLIVEQPVHEFGLMMIGEERQHTFVLHNGGSAPLILRRSDQSCSCFKLKLKSFEIPPGGSEEATVTWKVQMPREFLEKLRFDTNDPEQPQFDLQFKGRVIRLVEIEPAIWNAGTISEETAAEVTGVLLSHFEDFQISSIECSNPQITAEAVRATEEEQKAKSAKAAYRIRVTIPPASARPGPLREFLTIHTSINGGTPFKVDLMGNRPGPLQIIGPSWDSKLLYLELNNFPAAEGKAARLSLRVTGMTEEFRFLEVQPDDDRIAVSLDHNEAASGTTQLFWLRVSVKPGMPPAARTGKKAVTVRVKTNHPQAPELTFYVDFVTS